MQQLQKAELILFPLNPLNASKGTPYKLNFSLSLNISYFSPFHFSTQIPRAPLLLPEIVFLSVLLYVPYSSLYHLNSPHISL